MTYFAHYVVQIVLSNEELCFFQARSRNLRPNRSLHFASSTMKRNTLVTRRFTSHDAVTSSPFYTQFQSQLSESEMFRLL